MKQPEPIFKHEQEVNHKDQKYNVVIKSYAEPIRKNEAVSCFTRIAIMDGQFEWGHTLLPNPVAEDEVASIIKMIEDNFEKFKNV